MCCNTLNASSVKPAGGARPTGVLRGVCATTFVARPVYFRAGVKVGKGLRYGRRTADVLRGPNGAGKI